jgi:TrmH family RNA methyltransferase
LKSKDVFQKLAYRDTEGILAIAKTKSQQLSDLKLSDNPLILVAEAPSQETLVLYYELQMQLILMP